MADAATPLLSMRGINKSFVGVPALIDADFEVRRGEVHALIGQNGAGKSTLIKVLTGVLAKDSGRIEFDNRGMHVLKGIPGQWQLFAIRS